MKSVKTDGANVLFQIHTPELRKVASLNPVAYNPRKITPEKFEALKRNIMLVGFLEPIVIQKNGLNVIGGHQRLRSVKELALEAGVNPPDIPCIVLDLNDVDAKKLNVKLNNLKGDFEARMLGELLIDVYPEPKDVTFDETMMLGFSPDEVIDHMRLVDPDILPFASGDGEEPRSFAKSVTLSLEFDSVRTRDRIKKLLIERTKLEKKKNGDIVAALVEPKRKSKRATRTAA